MERSVLTREIVSHWPAYLQWRAALIATLDPRLYTAEWLDEQVMSGRFILLANRDAAILASVQIYPTGLKEIQGELATGKRETIVSALIPCIEREAKAAGCSSALIQSRQGWIRVMRKFGYNLHQSSIRKAL